MSLLWRGLISILALCLTSYVSLAAEDALHSAVRAGDITKIKELLDAGSSVDSTDENGLTPLHKAVYQARMDMVRILVAA